MFSPYRGRYHTKKQKRRCKQPISLEERKRRDFKKRMSKIFAGIRFYFEECAPGRFRYRINKNVKPGLPEAYYLPAYKREKKRRP